MYERKYSRTESFQDLIARLYPLSDIAPDVRERILYDKDGYPMHYVARTVTFQVTDDCNLCCVPAGTLILMADKTEKPIEEISIGDKILTFNEKPTHAYPMMHEAEVTATMSREIDHVYDIITDSASLTVTGNHPLLYLNPFGFMEYKEVSHLRKGNTIYEYSGRQMVARHIRSIEKRAAKTIVYNLTTSLGTYVANKIAVHNCSYCYQINKKHHSMPFEVAKEFADMILESTKENNDYITVESSPGVVFEFIGGEPFLEIDLISKISDYLVQRMTEMRHPWRDKFMFSICSNGLLYKNKKVQAYMEKYKYNISFSVSIDGNKELHDSCRVKPDGSGSYDIAIDAVNHYREHFQGKMGSKMTMAPSNITYVYDAVKNLIDLKYDEIYLNCVYEKGWEPHHATELYNQFKMLSDYMIESGHFEDTYLSYLDDTGFHPMGEEHQQNWCGGTGSMIAVDYKGDIYPCLRYMESSIGDDIEAPVIGTVEKGFMYDQKTKDLVHDMRAISRRSQSEDECYYCPIAQLCSWCSAYNYQEFGTINKRATYICIMHKSRALTNIYYWNKGFKKYAPWFKFASWIPKEYALEVISEEEYNMLLSLIEFTDEDRTLTQKMLDEGKISDRYINYAKTALETNRPVFTNDIGKVIVDALNADGSPCYDEVMSASKYGKDVIKLDEPIDYTSIAYAGVFAYINKRGFDIHAVKLMEKYGGLE